MLTLKLACLCHPLAFMALESMEVRKPMCRPSVSFGRERDWKYPVWAKAINDSMSSIQTSRPALMMFESSLVALSSSASRSPIWIDLELLALADQFFGPRLVLADSLSIKLSLKSRSWQVAW